jgi:hypothetical protein
MAQSGGDLKFAQVSEPIEELSFSWASMENNFR